jgi:hypothetical protein
MIRAIEVMVGRGEDAGKTLPHKNVVREIILLGQWQGEVAIVQTAGEGPVLAAQRAVTTPQLVGAMDFSLAKTTAVARRLAFDLG